MAIADNPHGPWKKVDGPILQPSTNGVWKGDVDNRFLVEEQGDFDSHKSYNFV